MDNLAINHFPPLSKILLDKGYDQMLIPINDLLNDYFVQESKAEFVIRCGSNKDQEMYQNDKHEILESIMIGEETTGNSILSSINKKNLEAKGKQLLTKTAIYSAGKMFLPPQILPFVELTDVAKSKDKTRTWFKVLPSIGIALIPGIGLPLAIGLGFGASYASDKIYTNFINPENDIDTILKSKYQKLNLRGFLPKEDFGRQLNQQIEEYSKICIKLKQKLWEFDHESVMVVQLTEELWSTIETIVYEMYFRIFIEWDLTKFCAEEFFVRIGMIEGLLIEYHQDVNDLFMKLLKAFNVLIDGDLATDNDVRSMMKQVEPSLKQLGDFISVALAEGVTDALSHMTSVCMEMKGLMKEQE